jgi:hypothetical protein
MMGSNRFGRAIVNSLVIGTSGIKKRVKISLPDEYRIKEIHQFDERFNKFWERVSVKYDMAVVRDSSYLNHQYVRVGLAGLVYKTFVAEKRDEVMGYIVLGQPKKQKELGKVLDIVVDEIHHGVAEALIKQAEEYFSDLRIDLISYTSIRDAGLWRHFKKCGYFAHPIRAREPFCFIKDLGRLNEKGIKRNLHWYFQIGDLDFT